MNLARPFARIMYGCPFFVFNIFLDRTAFRKPNFRLFVVERLLVVVVFLRVDLLLLVGAFLLFLRRAPIALPILAIATTPTGTPIPIIPAVIGLPRIKSVALDLSRSKLRIKSL